jgi:hypothetical protein
MLQFLNQSILGTSGVSFTPKHLFAAGEQGAWYDPPDLTTLFQDSAGTIPVTAVEQPVGLILDKSGRGNHASQSTATKRPTYSARYNLLLATETLSTQNVTTAATTYTLTFGGAGSITLSGTKTGTYTAGTHSLTGVTAGTLTLTVSGSVTQADIRPANDGVGLPAYQRVTTATDYDTVGFPPYLRFDGVDDALATDSINFTGTDKMAVFVGARRATGAQCLVELGTTSESLGGFYLFSEAISSNTATFAARGGRVGQGNDSASPNWLRDSSAVISCYADINAGLPIKSRTNGGAFENSVNTTFGGGNFRTYPIYIGARVGTGYYFNGRIYSLIVRGAQTSDAQIAQVETYLNQRAKVY